MTQNALTAELLAPELAGDARELLAQLGSPEALPALPLAASVLKLDAVRDAGTLRRFLAGYRDQILVPVELPAILAAHGHATRNELRELLALDRELGRDPRLKEFRAASAAVGRRQLAKLRPLRDQRFVQRYLRAVENAKAHGWHTLIFGVFLAQYSLPLRQGLVLYGQRILRAFKNHEVERAAHEARLEQLNRFLDELFQNTVDPLAAVDGEFKVIRINRAASALFGYRSEEIEGSPIAALSPDIGDLIRRTNASDAPEESRQITGVHKDRTEIPLDVATSTFDLSGVRRYVVTLRDATQRLRAQDALVRSSRLMAVGDMTAALAHEFNSPLAAVQGNLTLLRRLRARDNEVAELADDALVASRSIAGLVKRLMTVSQRQMLRPRPTDLRHFLDGARASFKSVIGNAGLEMKLPSSLTRVSIDDEQLQLVLLGIATNAREAMPEIDGHLTIECQERTIAGAVDLTESEQTAGVVPGRYAVVAVTDNGTGMTRAQIAAAIEPFRATRPVGQTGGMELAVAQGFARQSGGALMVESEPGRGTTVMFYLPMLDTPVQNDGRHVPAAAAAE